MFGRRGRGMRMPYKPARYERNHFEATTTTAAATESYTDVAIATDDVVNRGTSFPTGAVMTKIVARLYGTDATPVAGKHQCMLFYQPGARVYSAMFAGWFLTTNPATTNMIDVRRDVLEHSPKTIVTITGASGPPRMTCFWKGRKVMHDGDDIKIAHLDAAATNWLCVIDYTFIR